MKRALALVAALFCVTALIASCVSSSGKDFTSNQIATDGSTSVEKVIGVLGESYTNENPSVSFTFNPTGSVSGIKAVQEGRCDIGISSRALKDEEKAQGLTETILALDGIAIIVNPSNPIADLSIDELRRVFSGEITNWEELGGNQRAIVVIGREAGSGTRDGFESITDTKDCCNYRQELTSTGDIITAVSQNEGAIGYASFASVKESVKKITIDKVEATDENVLRGSYKIQRPFVMITKTDQPLSATAQAFFDYAISPTSAELITFAGAIPVVEEQK